MYLEIGVSTIYYLRTIHEPSSLLLGHAHIILAPIVNFEENNNPIGQGDVPAISSDLDGGNIV